MYSPRYRPLSPIVGNVSERKKHTLREVLLCEVEFCETAVFAPVFQDVIKQKQNIVLQRVNDETTDKIY